MKIEQPFELHPLAAQDISNIWEYISYDNVHAAGRVREEFIKAIHNLVVFPNQGHKRPDLISGPVRFKIVREYLIAYNPNKMPLLVLAVIHAHRSPLSISVILQGRQ